MSFTCMDCHDETCAQHGSSDAACDEFTTEYVSEAEVVASMPTPVQIASCDCHADHELRLCTLEDLVSRVVREMTKGREL